jgi:hypothetical protein
LRFATKGVGFLCLRSPRETSTVPIAGDIQHVEITTYPFFASAEREVVIRQNYRRVMVGMSPADVAAILGKPDEIRAVYQPRIWRPEVTGYSHWYVVRRLTVNGSVNDKREALVRIIFGLDDRVTDVDAWGL